MKFPAMGLARASMGFLARRTREAGEFIFPATCAACGEAGLADDPLLCEKCSAALDELARVALCPKCAMPVGIAGGSCGHCQGRGMFPLEKIVALGLFRDPLKELIHRAKYHQRWNLAEVLAKRLARQQRAAELLAQCDCVVAVPLHWSRQVHRGYNQAEVIARCLRSGRRRLPVARALARVKNTEPQTLTHSWEARESNVRDAFELVGGKSVAGKWVLLVDDVTTTRSTLRAAARALREARPLGISAIVLAVADPRGRDFQAI